MKTRPPPVQPLARVTTHAPAVQHAPPQGLLGEQVVETPWKVPPQLLDGEIVHAGPLQQAPVQGVFGPQAMPSPR
jgi:hypothetical protein